MVYKRKSVLYSKFPTGRITQAQAQAGAGAEARAQDLLTHPPYYILYLLVSNEHRIISLFEFIIFIFHSDANLHALCANTPI